LLLKVKDLMHTGRAIPRVQPDASLTEVIAEMTAQSLGMTTIQDDAGQLLGVFTDGDLRRAVAGGNALEQQKLSSLPHGPGTTITADALAEQALFLMESKQITAVVVLDAQQQVVGVLHLHDLLRAGLS
jgi:arabinose-5-phosphate isomerase